ncbi:MAG: hypothetical protein KC731_22640 [Myxococcales bacterium]|nr:hypothetical protein [Myxococcales bacterium]
MHHPSLLLVGSAALALAALALDLHAQEPASTASASASAAVEGAPRRDLERDPPKNLGSKLDPVKGWEEAEEVALARRHVPRTGWGDVVFDTDHCDFKVVDDWLRVWCRSPIGRVSQTAGDPRDTVIHISNQIVATGPNTREDRRRLALYIRLVPGRVTVVEATSLSESAYGEEWEGAMSLLTVDWSDESRGPRINVARSALGYAI